MRSLTVFAVLGAASILFHCTKAANYQVGDSTGWRNPNNATFYSSWASAQTFAVGDTLTFNFATGSHDVATVSKSDYDSCNTNQNNNNILRTGPATITLAAGTHYYLCTFDGHCSAGQKFSVNVSSSGTASPPGSPPSPGTITPSSPPPPGGSASSIGATFALMFMSIVMGFMFYF